MPVMVICLTRSRNASGELVVRLGVRLLDEYLEFLAGRCRPGRCTPVRRATTPDHYGSFKIRLQASRYKEIVRCGTERGDRGNHPSTI